MDMVLRALAIYLFLLLIFRLSGSRTMAQTTPFDLVLLLIIAEAVQQALLGDDFSVTNALVLIVVLIGADIVMSVLKEHMPLFEKVVDGSR